MYHPAICYVPWDGFSLLSVQLMHFPPTDTALQRIQWAPIAMSWTSDQSSVLEHNLTMCIQLGDSTAVAAGNIARIWE